MKMRYFVEARTIWLLGIAMCVSILLAVASGVLGWQFYVGRQDARAVVARADSLVADWVRRGCAPRSQTLP